MMPPALRHAVLAALLLALAGCGKSENGGGQAKASQPPANVTVAKPLVRKLTEWDEFTGRFEPVQAVDVHARVSGYVTEIGFEDGQTVEKGRILFVIDPRPYKAAVDQAQAAVTQADSQVRLAVIEADRARKLVTTSAVAKEVLDQRNATLEGAQATLGSAQAQLDQAKLNLGFTQVTAPFRGRISNRRVDRGNLIDNATLLTTIVELDPIYLSFDMSESDFLAYQRVVASGKMPSTRDHKTIVEAHLVDEDDWPHKGTMDFVDNAVNQNSGTIRARGIFPNANLLMTPGQFGRIRIPGTPDYDAVLIPDDAVVTDQSRKLVLFVDKEGKVSGKPVKLGPTTSDGLRIVRDGLKPDEKIIINGLASARPGSKVNVHEGKVEPGNQETAAN